MEIVIFFLIVALIWLWSRQSDLAARETKQTDQLAIAKDQLNELAVRVLRLEGGQTHAPPMASPGPEPASAPAPPPVVVPEPAVAADKVTTPAPFVAHPFAWADAPPPAAGASETTSTEADFPDESDVARPPIDVPVGVAAAAAVATEAERPESWEMTVGTSWFNKIGVLVFIIGVALLVAYSFNNIGPAGRVAIGFVLSFATLASGVVLERRDGFRNYGYGLVAGGWAGVYFTTYAMHDVPGAKILDNPVAAVTLLSAVAAGMIAHSLRYRSQVVTSLAFIVAYSTLALSPVSGFSLAASVPLAVALLLVSQRLGWASVSALGIVATYGTFALRGAIFPDGVLNPHSALPYVMLATYWLTFEAADITGLRSRAGRPMSGDMPVPMLALNATGFMGAMLLTMPRDNPHLLSVVLFSAASAYVASALLRAWLLPGWRARHATDEPFDSTHGATAIAAALFAIAIDIRFVGNRESLARLLEAQLLVTAGLTLGDVWLRRMGSVALALAAGHALQSAIAMGAGAPVFDWTGGATSGWSSGLSMGATSAMMLLIAAACYGNREALHRRDAALVWVEGSFTWIAGALVSLMLVLELDPAHQAIAGLAVAALLIEVGFRRTREYIYQAYVIGGFASYGMLAAFLTPATAAGVLANWGAAPTSLDEWTVLPSAVVLTIAAAWRLFRRAGDVAVPNAVVAAGASAVVSTALLMLFEWRVLAPNAIAPAWALTAIGLVVLGTWRQLPIFRWLAYVVSLAATVRSIGPLLNGPPDTTSQTVAIGVVIAAVYVVAYLGRRALSTDAATPDAETGDSFEGATVGALSIIATASLVVFKWRVLPELLVAPAWAATGFVLVALGIWRQRPGQRVQGEALAALGSVRVMQLLVAQPLGGLEAASSMSLWAAVVVATVYGSSWLARRVTAASPDPAALVLPILGTVTLALLESRVSSDLVLGPAWAATAVALLGLGVWRGAMDIRWQGYALLAFGALRTGQPVFGTPDPTTVAIAWLGGVIAVLHACGLGVRRMTRDAESAGQPNPAEDAAGAALLLGGTAMLVMLILQEVRPSMVTLALGVQGLGLMLIGLVARERVMRLSGLGLLLGCILKLFVYDLREREALERIMSFVFLGLFLLGISWTYTRYREQIRKFL